MRATNKKNKDGLSASIQNTSMIQVHLNQKLLRTRTQTPDTRHKESQRRSLARQSRKLHEGALPCNCESFVYTDNKCKKEITMPLQYFFI